MTQKRGRVEALSQKELHQLADLDFRDPDLRTRLLELRTEMGRSTGQYQGEVSPETWVAHVELARDKFLQCCYTGLRISDADRRGLAAHGNIIVLDNTVKTDVTVYISFYNDDLFKPVALASRYEHRSPLVPI